MTTTWGFTVLTKEFKVAIFIGSARPLALIATTFSGGAEAVDTEVMRRKIMEKKRKRCSEKENKEGQ
jgi:hypothetical protein